MTDAQTADFLENGKKKKEKKKATHNILYSTDEEHIFRKIDLGGRELNIKCFTYNILEKEEF